jgi:hypothetical protein
VLDSICIYPCRGVYPPEAVVQTSPVEKFDDLFLSPVSLVSHFSFPHSHASPLPSHPSLLLLSMRLRGFNPRINFQMMPACRRILAHFSRKNPVCDESTKSSPLFWLKVLPPIFFHGAFAPGFTLCRHSCIYGTSVDSYLAKGCAVLPVIVADGGFKQLTLWGLQIRYFALPCPCSLKTMFGLNSKLLGHSNLLLCCLTKYSYKVYS